MKPSPAPNILLITTDQQRWDTLHCAGNNNIFTPHLNWLSDTGIRYDRAYSDCPVCMPARATLMTGLPAYVHGAVENSKAEPMRNMSTLPSILTSAGYQTRGQGKMHFHPTRNKFGFEEMEISYDYYRFMQKHYPDQSGALHGQGQNELEPIIGSARENKTLTHWVVDRSIDFLETRDTERPFFLWSSFSKPHPPLDPSLKFWELYRDMPIPSPVSGDWSKDLDNIPEGFLQSTFRLGNGYRFSKEQMLKIKQAYYACITEVDASLGLLFSRLRELNLLENTWIIFTSDHGEMLGDHHMTSKSVFFEGSAHIPLLMRPPGIWDQHPMRGTVCDKIANLQDILPTCLSIAGLEHQIPKEAKGLNLCKMAENKEERTHMVGVSSDSFSVISNEWKYHFTAIGGDSLLFNLKDDPMELHDLSKSEPSLLQEMHQLLIDTLASSNSSIVDKGEIPIKNKLPLADERRWNSWPGFHSTKVESDLLH